MDEDIDQDLVINTLIYITFLLIIVGFIPSLYYMYYKYQNWKIEISSLLHVFLDKEDESLEVKFNTMEDMYLFCTYIPHKKIRICESNNVSNNVSKNDDNILDMKLELFNVNKIKEKLINLKKFCDGKSYDDIKAESDIAIEKNKAARIKREHDLNLVSAKDAGKNARFASSQFLKWVERISSWLYSLLEIFFRIYEYFLKLIQILVPVLKAIFQNKVITGYMVIIITIYLIIWGIKKATDPPKEADIEEVKQEEEEGFFAAMYREYLETMAYYKNLAKNVRMPKYTSGVFGGDANEDDPDDDTIIDRPVVKGELYDNLSYIVLSDLGLSTDDLNTFFKTKIDSGKYYNIYLPEEKYKNIDDTNKLAPAVMWKVSDANNKNNNEKKWKLDCEKIDTIMKGDVDTNNPAFISNEDKCVINVEGLKKAAIGDTLYTDMVYKTEYIK